MDIKNTTNSNVSFGRIWTKGNPNIAQQAVEVMPKRLRNFFENSNEYGLSVNVFKGPDNIDRVTFKFVEEKDGKPVKSHIQRTFILEQGVKSLKNQGFSKFVGSVKKALFGEKPIEEKPTAISLK